MENEINLNRKRENMKKKPIIGISTSIIADNSGYFALYPRNYVNKDYVDAVIKNGGIPLMIPMSLDEEIIAEQISMIDGLILSGGHDVCPHNYGEEPSSKLEEILPERDEYDFILLREAKKRKLPILGICRGCQIINVFEGGTLYQDLSYIKNDREILKHSQDHSPELKTHTAIIENDTKIYKIFGENNIMINSFHHQALKDIAKDYIVSANAKDGVVEAIESTTYPFLVGVQWHPEMMHKYHNDANKIFKALIDEAGKTNN